MTFEIFLCVPEAIFRDGPGGIGDYGALEAFQERIAGGKIYAVIACEAYDKNLSNIAIAEVSSEPRIAKSSVIVEAAVAVDSRVHSFAKNGGNAFHIEGFVKVSA